MYGGHAAPIMNGWSPNIDFYRHGAKFYLVAIVFPRDVLLTITKKISSRARSCLSFASIFNLRLNGSSRPGEDWDDKRSDDRDTRLFSHVDGRGKTRPDERELREIGWGVFER
jgi:hypothetical protein